MYSFHTWRTDVGQQLAHVYRVRRTKLEQGDKELAKTLPEITREHGHDKTILIDGFERSGEAIAELIRRSMAKEGKVKGFKRGIVALTGYFIAHDAHHRGQILLTLKQAKVKFSPNARMALWAWNQI
ncbi:MAG: hypothetical protein P9L92_00300 [Candidatus Electryonea clarkiae]|nr:hypothetical protein [Candidatus Electryonea clarkiae]MDP8285433.1 hypothetical protein [Candidatus Electryonea clarkiae]